MQVHQVCAGIVGLFRFCFTGQTETDIVLALKDPLDILETLRFIILQPGKQCHRLAGHNMLAGALKDPFLRAVLLPADRVSIGSVIGGDDAVADRPAVLSPQVKALAMAADADTGHLFRIHACFFQHLPNHGAVCLPHFLHIPLHEIGGWGDHGSGNTGDGNFSTVL